jgi:hypothetical protein
LAGVVWGVGDFRSTAGGPKRLSPPAAAPVPSAVADHVIDFNGFPKGYYSFTEDGDAFNPFTVLSTPLGDVTAFGINTRPRIDDRNAAVIFDTADPHVNDPDLGSPNETCTPPGPGVSADGLGEVGALWENCPDPPIEKGLVIGTRLDDTIGDGLVDDPDDEGTVNWNPQIELDFSDIGLVTLVEMTVLDKEEGPATVQMFDDMDNLVGFIDNIGRREPHGGRAQRLGDDRQRPLPGRGGRALCRYPQTGRRAGHPCIP